MDNFSVKQALQDLDRPTPVFFKMEIFAHGDQTVPRLAVTVLNSLNADAKTTGVLCSMLRVVPDNASAPE